MLADAAGRCPGPILQIVAGAGSLWQPLRHMGAIALPACTAASLTLAVLPESWTRARTRRKRVLRQRDGLRGLLAVLLLVKPQSGRQAWQGQAHTMAPLEKEESR